MKNLLLLACLLLRALALSAQDDLDFGEEYVPPQARALDRWAAVFGTKEPARVAFKWNALALLPPTEIQLDQAPNWQGLYAGEPPFVASVEGKLTAAFSLVGTFGATRFWGTLPLSSSSYSTPFLVLSQRIEPRFYFEMPRRAQRKKQADNLSANYIGLEYAHWSAAALGRAWAEIYSFPIQKHGLTLRAGLQRRFLRQGWFDLSLGVGRSWRTEFYGFGPAQEQLVSRVVFAPRLVGGLLFGDFPEKKASRRARCAALGCRDEDFFWGKLDLYGLLAPQTDGATGRLSLAWEWKLGRAPLSIEVETQIPYAYRRQDVGGGTYYANGYVGGGGAVEPRWFLGKNRRVRQGKSAHNLNGLFIGYNASASWQTGKSRQLRATPVIGLQSRLFDRGFVSYKVGYGKSWLHTCTENFWGEYCQDFTERHLLSEFKVGLLW